jgi:leucyl/phenylalanyl-tRNA--protein transferase
MRNSQAEVRFNCAFGNVVRECAGERRSQQGTWITDEMIAAYEQLHEDGWAHSIEIWDDNELVGGLYGICIGDVFFGESMFSKTPNSSKMAMLGLVTHMQSCGLQLIDCQVVSRHLMTLGARVISRPEFTDFLASACNPSGPQRDWPTQPTPVAQL